MSDPLIHLSGVARSYSVGKTAVVALAGIDLTIARGEFTALVGPSGSGKSTLLNLIGGLDRPSSGEIRVDGLSSARPPSSNWCSHRRERVGFIFQSFNLLPTFTAVENVESPMVLAEVPRSERRTRATACWSPSGWRKGFSTSPTNFPAAKNNASPLPARWRIVPCCCWRMNRRESRFKNRRGRPRPVVRPGQKRADAGHGDARSGSGRARRSHHPFARRQHPANRNEAKSGGTAMTIHDQIRTAFSNVGRRKLRSALASLGVVVGTFTIVLMVSLASGVRRQINHQFESLGLDRLTVYSSRRRARRF